MLFRTIFSSKSSPDFSILKHSRSGSLERPPFPLLRSYSPIRGLIPIDFLGKVLVLPLRGTTAVYFLLAF